MKKIMLALHLVLMIFVYGHINAQIYHPLIKSNKFWDVQFTDGSICGLSGGGRFFIQGDTIISGKKYNIVRGYGIVPVNSGPYCPPFAIDESISGIHCFLREDTIEKKVYKYETIYSQEDLYYDFSLSIGDTLKSHYATIVFGTTLIVTNVSLISLNNGELRKKFFLNNGEYYIESIGGGSKGLAEYLFNTLGGSSIQECVFENGVQLWYYDPCFGYLNINKAQNVENVSIYPNPSTDFINISGVVGEFTMAVYDYSGRLILQGENQKNIELSRFRSGIYMIKIVSEKGVYTGKVVRE